MAWSAKARAAALQARAAHKVGSKQYAKANRVLAGLTLRKAGISPAGRVKLKTRLTIASRMTDYAGKVTLGTLRKRVAYAKANPKIMAQSVSIGRKYVTSHPPHLGDTYGDYQMTRKRALKGIK